MINLLNRVDCTKAPNCIALNRNNCSSVANTCGSCLSDKYIGNDGDDNTLCKKAAGLSTSSHSSCNSVNDCGLWDTCVKGICVTNQKHCNDDCSGHGKCQYININTDEVINSCLATDFSCDAKCLCYKGYNTKTCSFSDADIAIKKSLREKMLYNLNDLITLENPSDETITTWYCYYSLYI
jgi:hypothetical protein